MVEVNIIYTGGLHCDATHGPSHWKLATDAPADNKKKGAAFSPTDLVATALGTCISTTMGIKAEELGVDLKGMTVSVQKEMSTTHATNRWLAIGGSYSAAAEFTASRNSRANGAKLSGAQKFAAGNQTPHEVFVGRLSRRIVDSLGQCESERQSRRTFPSCFRHARAGRF